MSSTKLNLTDLTNLKILWSVLEYDTAAKHKSLLQYLSLEGINPSVISAITPEPLIPVKKAINPENFIVEIDKMTDQLLGADGNWLKESDPNKRTVNLQSNFHLKTQDQIKEFLGLSGMITLKALNSALEKARSVKNPDLTQKFNCEEAESLYSIIKNKFFLPR